MLDINNTYVDAMFAFAERRHRFALGERIDDDIIAKHSFTNIYCELDESTAVIRKATTEGHYPRGILGALLYVLFHNPHTLRVMINHPLALKEFIETGDYTNLLKIMRSYYCTGPSEYLIKQPDGYTKLEGLLLIARHFRETTAWRETDRLLFNPYHMPDELGGEHNHYSYKTISYWLCDCKWIGPFLANEIAYEISQQIPKPFRDVNQFALCGTSTLRGIARLMGKYDKAQLKGGKGGHVTPKQLSQEQANEVCRFLLDESQIGFSHNMNSAEQWPQLRLREITRILGEFDRYERYRLGQRLYEIGDRVPDVIDNVNRHVDLFAPMTEY